MKTEETTQPGGEKGLIEQIASLQKQLDDCLEPKPLVKDERFIERMHNTIASLFMPFSVYNEYQKKYQKRTTRDIWWSFRSHLLTDDECKHLFASRDFREVMDGMNNFIDDLDGEPEAITFSLATSSAEVLLNNTTPKGWELAMEGLRIIEQYNETEDSYIFSRESLQDLWITLQTIHRCVKMYNEAAEPEQKADSNTIIH